MGTISTSVQGARAVVAALGVVAFACALAVPMARAEGASAPIVLIAGSRVELAAVDEVFRPAPAVSGVSRGAPHPAPTPAPVVAGSQTAQALPSLEPPPTGGNVIASWYGPGFYGNRTACGQLYTPEIVGVAHRTLPCGTLLQVSFRDRTVVVPVIDRGPYIAGRTLDLSNATRASLACTDLCPVRMQIVR